MTEIIPPTSDDLLFLKSNGPNHFDIGGETSEDAVWSPPAAQVPNKISLAENRPHQLYCEWNKTLTYLRKNGDPHHQFPFTLS